MLSAVKRSSAGVLALLAYAALSFLFFFRPHPPGAVFGDGTDPLAFAWFLNWWPYAISHGLNPFIARLVWAPLGSNMMWSASVPSLALAAWPITWHWDAVTSLNALTLAAPALNSIACYVLLRVLACRRLPAFLGGFFFGFSSYVDGHMLGHLNLIVVAVVPLLVAVAVLRARRAIARATYITAFAVLLALQFGISNEIFATAGVFALFAFAAFYPTHRDSHDLAGLARDTVYASVAALIVLAPALYYLVRGMSQLPPVIQPPEVFSADLLNLFVPTALTAIGGMQLMPLSNRFTAGDLAEDGAYLGLPLLIIMVLLLRESRGARWRTPLAITLAITTVASLGPRLWIAGHRTFLPLPWRIVTGLPFIGHALPGRFTMYLSLVAAILVAFWLDRPGLAAPRRWARYGAVLLAAALIVPNSPIFRWETTPTPAVLQRDTLASIFPASMFPGRPNLVVLPYAYLGGSMLWQIRSGMSFAMAGGYVGVIPTYFTRQQAVSYFLGITKLPERAAFETAIRAFCATNHVDGIVITPGTNEALATSLENLPWPRQTVADSVVIRVPAQLSDATPGAGSPVGPVPTATTRTVTPATAMRN